ncbi:hypothetical protein EDB83DRAFT_2678536 [Lactarius deliciosus]|nr:hypothetical protein EDB83DRAFT_2678536 [Lactarius deliciosus]
MTSEQIVVSDDARTIAVDGFGQLNVFYVHQRSAAKGAITLLSVHGCASSPISRFYTAEPLHAVSADHPSSHVVAPKKTLGFSLADSPVGRIYEKLVTWTDAYPWTDDEVRTWVSIHWFSPGACSTTVPVSLSYFPGDLVQFPRESSWLRAQAIIMFESECEVGRHFAAFEQPSAFVGDFRKMFGKSGPAAGVVLGCASY